MAVIGASEDDVAGNKRFAFLHGYPFVLLCDSDGRLARALGVLNPTWGVAYRWTYIVDPKGVIRAIDRDVKPATHGADLVKALRGLGVPEH